MYPEVRCCCKAQSSWIFVYENKSPRGICDKHFESENHRLFVKAVINIATGQSFTPDKIFKEIPAQ